MSQLKKVQQGFYTSLLNIDSYLKNQIQLNPDMNFSNRTIMFLQFGWMTLKTSKV